MISALFAVALNFHNPIPVAPITHDAWAEASLVSLVPSGDSFIAFTLQTLPFPSFPYGTKQLVATPVDRLGNPNRDAAVILRTGIGLYSANAAPTSDGFLLTWNEGLTGYAELVSNDLKVLREPVAIGAQSGGLACNRSRCAIAWRADGVTITDPRGSTTARILSAATGNFGAAIAATDSGFVFAWLDGGLTRSIHVVFFDNTGHIDGQSSIQTTYIGGAQAVAITPNPTGAFVVWSELAGVHGAMIDRAGNLLSSAWLATVPGVAGQVAVDWNGTDFLIAVSGPYTSSVGTEGTIEAANLYGLRVSAAGQAISKLFPICTVRWASFGPAVTHRDSSFVVAWNQTPGSVTGSARVAAVGQESAITLDGTPVVLNDADQGPIALAHSSEKYLAVWWEPGMDGRGVLKAARVGSNTPSSTLASGQMSGTTAASDGQNFAVVWRELDEIDVTNQHTVLAIIDGTSGAIEKKDLGIGAPRTRLLWDGSGYLLGVGYGADFRVVRLTSTGDLVTSTALSDSSPGFVSLGVIRDRALLMWSAFDIKTRQSQVVTALFDASGREIKRNVVANTGSTGLAVTSNGRDELLIVNSVGGALYANRINRDGQTIDGPGLGTIVKTGSPPDDRVSAVPLAGKWLIVSGRSAFMFPSGGQIAIDPAYDVIASASDRVALFQNQVVNGVRTAIIQEASDDTAPPRRRASGR